MIDLEAKVERVALKTACAGEEPYTSVDRVASQLCKEVDRFDAGEDLDRVRSIVRDIATRNLVYWHGLVAPVDEDCLAEWVAEEAASEIVREPLIGQLNDARQRARGGASA